MQWSKGKYSCEINRSMMKENPKDDDMYLTKQYEVAAALSGISIAELRRRHAIEPLPVKEEPQPENSTLNDEVRRTLSPFKGPGCATFTFVSTCYAGDILEIPVSLRRHAGVLIDFMRSKGFWVQLQTKLQCSYDPRTYALIPFSKEASERISIDATRRILDGNPTLSWIFATEAEWLGNSDLWSTKEGKQMAQSVVKLFPNTAPADENARKQMTRPVELMDPHLKDVCDYDFPVPIQPVTVVSSTPSVPVAAAGAGAGAGAGVSEYSKVPDSKNAVKRKSPGTVEAPVASSVGAAGAGGDIHKKVKLSSVALPPTQPYQQAKVEGTSSPEKQHECAVCFSAAADTFVLPCMHRVVCRTCSAALAKTPDAKRCVQCRVSISAVLVDEYPAKPKTL
jgi:hypothetical protein